MGPEKWFAIIILRFTLDAEVVSHAYQSSRTYKNSLLSIYRGCCYSIYEGSFIQRFHSIWSVYMQYNIYNIILLNLLRAQCILYHVVAVPQNTEPDAAWLCSENQSIQKILYCGDCTSQDGQINCGES